MKDIPSWARQPFQRRAVGRDGLGEARRSCPGLLYPETQTEACAKAMPPSTHPWSAATARQGPPRAEGQSGPATRGATLGASQTWWARAHIPDALHSSPLSFPVPGQTVLTTLPLCPRRSPGHLVYKNKTGHLPPLSPSKFRPQKDILEKTSDALKQTGYSVASGASLGLIPFCPGGPSLDREHSRRSLCEY